MEHSYLTTWSAGWGWFLWMAIVLFMISSFGSWGYTYRIHRRVCGSSNALDILNERYAKGELTIEELRKMKSEILSSDTPLQSKPA